MPSISGFIPGPYDGVSQADPTVRLPGACEFMEDCLPVLPGGIQPRPPMTFIRKLVKPVSGDLIEADPYCLFQWVDRGGDNLDLALMLNREGLSTKAYLFFTYTWDPVPLVVTAGAQAYLDAAGAASKPCRDFRAVTIEDTTFIVNRTVPVQKSGDTAPTRPYEALLWVRSSGYARTISVTIEAPSLGFSTTATYSTGDGSVATHSQSLGTDKIAKSLYDGTNPGGGSVPNPNPLLVWLPPQGFTVELDGSLIYISHPTADFTIKVSDDAANTDVVAIKGEVQRFSDLPEVAREGFTVRIAQEAAGANNDYFVEFVPAGSSTKGVWKEVIEPGSPLGLAPPTMPLRLYIDETTGDWTLDIGAWTQRTVGNERLSGDPAFVGETIQDVNWWRGRLGLCSPGVYALSASNNPYQNYTTTLAAALDSDPIQLLPPAKGRRRFRQLITFDERVVVLGNKLQSIVGAGDSVTPRVTYIKPLANAEFFDQVPAQACSSKVYFGALRTDSLAIFELATDRISGQQIPVDVSAGIPTYIPATVDKAATLETEYLTLYGSSGSGRIIVHVFRHDDQAQRVQNAWCAWNLRSGYTLGGMFFESHFLFLAMVDPDGNFTVASMDLSPDHTDEGGTILTYADMRNTEQGHVTASAYDALNDHTTFTLDRNLDEDLRVFVRTEAGFGGYPEGYALDVLEVFDGDKVRVRGNWIGAPLWFGYPFSASFSPTRPYKRGSDGNPELEGRVTVKHGKLTVRPGSTLKVHVDVRGRDRMTPVDGTVGGDVPLLPQSQRTSVQSFPVGGRNEDTTITIEGDTHLGFRVLGLEWYGTWNQKAARVT